MVAWLEQDMARKAPVATTMAIRMAMRVAIPVIRITYSRIWVATMMLMSNRTWAWQALALPEALVPPEPPEPLVLQVLQVLVARR
eukprot:symbB.v1.2.023666.t1/scaffold2180.1/size86746/2